jgi:ABC-type nitrate/sulfonate/bicarbonate transport system substrate-binding protein
MISTVFAAPTQAADKIRISMTGFAGQFMTYPLAQKRGFLKEEGFEAEVLRIAAAAGRAALTNGDIDYSTGIGGTRSAARSRESRSKSSPVSYLRRCWHWWRDLSSKPFSRSKVRQLPF